MIIDKYKFLGKRLPLKDSIEKATGRAVFSSDIILPGMLFAKILRSPHAHAKIVNIDTGKAADYPGVRAVATAKDAPDTRFGISITDERFFAIDEVHYVGDEVVAVVAIDEKTASEALKLIDVEYEILHPVLDPEKAILGETELARGDTDSNISYHSEVQRGDIEKGFREADIICEEIFYTQHQYQAYIEPHSATAQWLDGRLTVWAPHQAPAQLEKVVCGAFNLPSGGFQFFQTFVGGAFGGKSHMRVIPLAALLAKLVNAPVKLSLSREEDFQAGLPRVPMVIKLKMGVRNDGLITAKEVSLIADNGAFTASALGIIEVAITYVDNLYRYRNIKAVGDLVYTNKLGTSAFRGYGNVQLHFAVESMMDILAEQLGIDPLELRSINAVSEGDVTVHGRVIDSCGLSEALEIAARETQWEKKRKEFARQTTAENSTNKVRGIGMACGVHGSGTTRLSPIGSAALVRIFQDGTVHVASSEGDIGQGARTVQAMIVSEVLDVSYENVYVEKLDTDITNFGVGAISSRVTVLGGHGVRAAAFAARDKVLNAAADMWGCDVGGLFLADNLVVNRNTEESVSIGKAASHYVAMTGGSRLIGEALYKPEGVVIPGDDKYGNQALNYPFAVQVAEVEVDLETGSVEVISLTAVHDAGRVLNHLAFEGQVEGGMSQGIGYALGEEYIFKSGLVLNPDFTNYRVPTFMDMPEMKVLSTQTIDPNGPFGAKSVGEIAMVPVAPAIANAIYHAAGIRLNKLPMKPESIFNAMQRLL